MCNFERTTKIFCYCNEFSFETIYHSIVWYLRGIKVFYEVRLSELWEKINVYKFTFGWFYSLHLDKKVIFTIFLK